MSDGRRSDGGPVDRSPRRSWCRRPVPADPDVRIGTLANGLTYYIRHNERPGGRAELRLAVNAGSVDEEPDQSGVAHFVEHMLFNGTEQFPENELIDVLRGFGAEFGADINAYTSLRRDRLPARRSPPTTTRSWRPGSTCWPSGCRPRPSTRPRSNRSGAWCSTSGAGRQQSSQGRVFDAIERLFLAGTAVRGPRPDRHVGGDRVDDAASRCGASTTTGTGPTTRRSSSSATSTSTTSSRRSSERFESLSSRASRRRSRTSAFVADTEPAVEVLADPDQPAAFVEVTLPVPAVAPGGVGAWRDEVLDGIAFEAIADRLASDAQRRWGRVHQRLGRLEQPRQGSRRAERPRRYHRRRACPTPCKRSSTRWSESIRDGFGSNEITRLVTQRRTAAESTYEARATVQDVEYAERVRRQLPQPACRSPTRRRSSM